MQQKIKSGQQPTACPCGGGKDYEACCALLHRGAPAPDAEALMRSRYSAFVLNLQEYIARSWHSTTRPVAIQLGTIDADKTRWIGLKIKRHELIDADHALVEFSARYKIAGRAFVLHEASRFVRESGHWFYINGEIM